MNDIVEIVMTTAKIIGLISAITAIVLIVRMKLKGHYTKDLWFVLIITILFGGVCWYSPTLIRQLLI